MAAGSDAGNVSVGSRVASANGTGPATSGLLGQLGVNDSMAPPSCGLSTTRNQHHYGSASINDLHCSPCAPLSPMPPALMLMADLNRWLASYADSKLVDLNYVRAMVEQFFEPDACIRINIARLSSGVFSIHRPVIAHFFNSLCVKPKVRCVEFHCGESSVKSHDAHTEVACTNSKIKIAFNSPRALVDCNCEWQLDIVRDANCQRIRQWTIISHDADEYILKDVVKDLVGDIQITQGGFTYESLQVLKISQVLHPMQRLMFMHKQNGSSPRDCLEEALRSRAVATSSARNSTASQLAIGTQRVPTPTTSSAASATEKKTPPMSSTTATTEKSSKRKRSAQGRGSANKRATSATSSAAALATSAATAASPDTTSLQSQANSSAATTSTSATVTVSTPTTRASSVATAAPVSVAAATAAASAPSLAALASQMPSVARTSQSEFVCVASPILMENDAYNASADERIIRRVENPHYNPVLAQQQEEEYQKKLQQSSMHLLVGQAVPSPVTHPATSKPQIEPDLQT